MTRYRTIDELGGAEIEADPSGWGDCVSWPGPDGVVLIPRSLLVEVPDPVPPEPEPGAYLIGDTLCVRFEAPVDSWCWQVEGRDPEDGTFGEVWREAGGPDVTIRRLVPDPAVGVTLPWTLGDVGVRCLDNGPLRIEVRVDGDWVRFTADEARQMASALMAATEEADHA